MRRSILLACLLLTVHSIASAQWVRTNAEIGPGYYVPLAECGSSLFAASTSVWTSSDDGLTWTNVSAGLPPTSTIRGLATGDTAATDQVIFVAKDCDGLWKSSDRGDHWSKVDFGLPYRCVTAVAVRGQTVFAGTDQDVLGDGLYSLGVVRSTNMGATWAYVNTGLIDSVMSRRIRAFYFVGPTIVIETDSGLYQTSDQGDHWFRAGLPMRYADDVVQDSTNVLVANDSLLRSTNRGATWSETDKQMSLGGVRAVALRGSQVLVTYDSGVAYSNDLGETWRRINEGMPDSLSAKSLLLHGSYIFASTRNGSIYRRALGEFLNGVAAMQAAQSSLSVFPNPLSHSTTIQFNPTDRGYARITIVNEVGDEVAHIFSGELETGEHSFEWNAASAPGGAYVCLVNLNGRIQHTPVVVARP